MGSPPAPGDWGALVTGGNEPQSWNPGGVERCVCAAVAGRGH